MKCTWMCKEIYYIILYVWDPRVVNFIENTMVVVGATKRNKELLFKGDRISVRGAKKSLRMDCVDNWTK